MGFDADCVAVSRHADSFDRSTDQLCMTPQPDDASSYQRAMDELAEQLGKRFVLGEMLGGQHLGARAVDAEDGTRGVLKVSDDAYRSVVEHAVRLAGQIRAAGYPAPRPLYHGPMPGGYFYLQERAPGRPMREGGLYRGMDAEELAILLGVLDRHAALAAGAPHDWSKSVEEVALHPRREWAVVAQSRLPVVQRLLEACERRLAGLSDPAMRHNDLVVGDFGPHNVLVDDEGRLTAVVDLESAGRGDRVIDTVGLLYMVEPHLLGVVRDAALAIASPEALAVCGVYWIIRRLHAGVSANADNLRSAAEQMLAYFDMLS
jgi:hypothetical protein